jgi:DNA-binding LytR/AlgR family response regulator
MKKSNEPEENESKKQNNTAPKELDPELLAMLRNPKDVMYILAWGINVRVYTESRGKLEFEASMKQVYALMPKKYIILGHRSNIINSRFVVSHYPKGDGLRAVMKDGAELKVTEAMKKRFKRKVGV